MKTLLISRYTTDTALGTLSKASFPNDPGAPVLDYLEPPWFQNQPFKSCVPPGVYAGLFLRSPKYGMVYYLVGGTVVYEESDMIGEDARRYLCIAGHGANWHQQLQGCGAFGKNPRRDHPGANANGNQRSHYVQSSRDTLKIAHAVLDEDPVIQVVIGWGL